MKSECKRKLMDIRTMYYKGGNNMEDLDDKFKERIQNIIRAAYLLGNSHYEIKDLATSHNLSHVAVGLAAEYHELMKGKESE